MARPTTYDRQNSFRLFSAQNPETPQSGTDLDTEFDALKLSLDETQDNLALIQDTDGKVARGSIGRAQLDSSVTIGVAPPAPWATATFYDADVSVVFHNLILYVCLVDHTSDVFEDDLNADKWLAIADFSAASSVDDGSITTAKLADGAVTTGKLGASSVSTAKILDSAVTTAKIADANVTTAKISDNAVTSAKVDASVWSTGDVKITLKSAADAGWLMMDDGTIGDADSGADHTGDDYEDLFTLLFNNIVDANAPLLTSDGTATTRTAQTDAATAWAAHCRITLTKVLGRALASAGSGEGLSAHALGGSGGAESVTIAKANLPSYNLTVSIPSGQGEHTHEIRGTQGAGGSATFVSDGSGNLAAGDVTTQAATLPAMSGTAATGGSGTALNVTQPTSFWNIMVKL